jgi:hypothetical protein
MSQKPSKEKQSGGMDPSEAPNAAPGGQNSQKEEAGEGSYRNVETSVNNKDYFDDEEEVRQEDRIAEDEAKSEKKERTGKS